MKSISGKEILLALVIGVVLSISVPILTLFVSQILPSNGGDIEQVGTNTTWWLILIAILTAGISEKLIFRGYLLERMSELTQKHWVAIVISVIAFVLPHTVSWNLAHVIGVVLPLGVILTGLYLLKRNLLFNMIVHVVIDLPLVFFALMTTESLI